MSTETLLLIVLMLVLLFGLIQWDEEDMEQIDDPAVEPCEASLLRC